LVVAFRGGGLSTAEVYRAYDATLTNRLSASSVQPFARARAPLWESLVNDLEAVAIRIYPPIRELKQQLVELGALGALMTGSGSAVFGVWERQEEASAAAERMRERGIWACAVEILDQTPGIDHVTADDGR
jgi:4-diphosphocytidyl-2-C-methyl-D-erythritol kinase